MTGAPLVLLGALVVLGITLVGESLNDLADPRLRTRRRADVAPSPTAEASAIPGGSLNGAADLHSLEQKS